MNVYVSNYDNSQEKKSTKTQNIIKIITNLINIFKSKILNIISLEKYKKLVVNKQNNSLFLDKNISDKLLKQLSENNEQISTYKEYLGCKKKLLSHLEKMEYKIPGGIEREIFKINNDVQLLEDNLNDLKIENIEIQGKLYQFKVY